jgi:hypothetical protein
MPVERDEHGTTGHVGNPHDDGGQSRRHLVAAAAGGLLLAASGLLPANLLEEAAARTRPVRRIQHRTQQRNRKRRILRARKQRRRAARRRQPSNTPLERKCLFFQILDMTIIFKSSSTTTHTMSVAEGEGDHETPFSYRWRDQVVPARGQFSFVGWYSGMSLNLNSVSPGLTFEAWNECVGFPQMRVSRATPSAQPEKLLEKGFSVGEWVVVANFFIERLPDADEHKVFQIRALD